KVYQLCFVIYFRDPTTGHENWRYVNFWSMMKAKAEFVIRAWTQIFTEGISDDFDEIICARDNGGHFRNYAILKFESELGFRYQKTYRVRSYAPHHRYNHVDRHGAQMKGWIRKAGKGGDKF